MTTLQSPPPTSHDLPTMQKHVEDRLSSLRSRVRLRIVLDGAARTLGLLVGLLLLGLILDWWLELSIAARALYWLVTLGLCGLLLYFYTLRPMSSAMGPVELAEAVDLARRAEGDALIAPRVSTVLELPRVMGDEQAVSGSMVFDAVSRSYAYLQDNPFDRQSNTRHLTWCIGGLAAAIVLPGLFALLMNGTAGVWANRWLALNNTPWPRNTQLAIDGLVDGKVIVPAGENATLKFTVTNQDGTQVDEVRLSLRPEGQDRKTKPVDQYEPGDYRFELPPHLVPIEASLSAGDQDLSFTIVPIARPRVADLELRHTHPADGVTNTVSFEGANGGLSLLYLNQVELHITSNVPLSEVRFAQGSNEPAELRLLDETHAVASWEQTEDVRFRIELVGKEAGLVSQPVPIAVRVKHDRVPKIGLKATGVRQRITANALVPLTIDARDDSGIGQITLQMIRERTGSSGREVFTYDPVMVYGPVEEITLDKLVKEMGLEIEDLDLVPTDLLRVVATATDDCYTGAQTGESAQLSFSVVTHDELFREIRARQELARAQFRQAIEDAKDIKEKLAQAQNGAEAAAQARAFRQAQASVRSVNQVLAASAEEMRLNRLGGSREEGNQAYQAMRQTVLDPMADLHDRIMAEQRDRIEGAPRSSAEQLAELTNQQQGVIDEMNLLLRAMDRWDQLMDVINQLNEVIGVQERIKPKLEELQNQEFDDFFDQ
ncbi:MAG: hypothetical protein AAGC44_04320 [Planctomycetota bacterium]